MLDHQYYSSRFFYNLYFFFNDTATTEIYTLSLHDALPISGHGAQRVPRGALRARRLRQPALRLRHPRLEDRPRPHLHHVRSEEHTSELQSRQYLVCRLLLEKKNIFWFFKMNCIFTRSAAIT